jgi:polyisoprenoid-binding protein YceI
MRNRLRRPSTYLVGVPVVVAIVVVLVAVVGPYVYIHFIEGPPPKELALEPGAPAQPDDGTGRSLDGPWRVTDGSQAGYRVDETLVGQGTTAVGRTSSVEGRFVLAGTVVQSGTFTVDLRTVSSDRTARDERFRNQIMDTAHFPTATFRLLEPAPIRRLPVGRQTVQVPVRGRLTLHGRSRRIAVTLVARRNGELVEVQGSLPIVFADYGIPNPSFGPAQTDDHGTIEFLLVFTRDA